jgi:shikimate dehydrogenase
MREFGLIGYPLDHAYSQKYFEEKFRKFGIEDAKYTLFPISEIGKIKNIIGSHPGLIGLNVTTPYKELVIPFLDEIDPKILKFGTINTIKIVHKNQKTSLKGFNTDVYGLRKSFDELNLPHNTRALVLGSGGSGRTVACVLKERGIEVTTVSREPKSIKQIQYSSISEKLLKNHNLIVNASPVGMFPNVDNCPDIPYQYISQEHYCFDLVYNPEKTIFLQKCEAKGAKILNGYTMLFEQADKAWEIWNEE